MTHNLLVVQATPGRTSPHCVEGSFRQLLRRRLHRFCVCKPVYVARNCNWRSCTQLHSLSVCSAVKVARGGNSCICRELYSFSVCRAVSMARGGKRCICAQLHSLSVCSAVKVARGGTAAAADNNADSRSAVQSGWTRVVPAATSHHADEVSAEQSGFQGWQLQQPPTKR
jgi:hypothetical protein